VFQGIDLLDLARPGSGLTLRRLALLIRALPANAGVWAVMHAAAEQAEEDRKTALIEERQAYWAERRRPAEGSVS